MQQILAARDGRVEMVNGILKAVFPPKKGAAGGAPGANGSYDIPITNGAAIREMLVNRFGAKRAPR
jgi:hypothetical protein